MLQQEKPEDFVIASGTQYSVRSFVDYAAQELGITLDWSGKGEEETGTVATINNSDTKLNVGDVIVRVDPRYYRPTEVESLLGDPTHAKEKLGWVPKITFKELVQEMMASDLEEAKKDALVEKHGYKSYKYHE